MRHSGKAPQLWQKLDAKDSTENILKRRSEVRAIRRARLALDGWSEWAVAQGFDGPIVAYEGSQNHIEMGLPKKLSDRKSKRKGSDPKIVSGFWYRYAAI